MTLTLFAFSRQGCRTLRKIAQCFPGETIRAYVPERFAEAELLPIPEDGAVYGERFAASDVMIFVGSCGIAVRKLAPYIRSKKTDPAVLCVDELGTFVISLLSGHIGGANALTHRLAPLLGAIPVVTTATDINHKFSVDSWAVSHGLLIDSMPLAKAVSAAILEQDVPFSSDFPVLGSYPAGLVPGRSGALGIAVTYSTAAPFAQTLRLIPRCLRLGIGCRRGTPEEAICQAVDEVFRANQLDLRAVKAIASIDLKAQEQGLLDYCDGLGIVPEFYTAQQLQEVPGEFTPSPFVQSITGVDNVCERSALLGAEKIIVGKTAASGVTVAVAAYKWEVSFE